MADEEDPVSVPQVRVRDCTLTQRRTHRFSLAFLLRWAGRTRSLDALLPVLYLPGDFQEALAVLLGKDTPNIS